MIAIAVSNTPAEAVAAAKAAFTHASGLALQGDPQAALEADAALADLRRALAWQAIERAEQQRRSDSPSALGARGKMR